MIQKITQENISILYNYIKNALSEINSYNCEIIWILDDWKDNAKEILLKKEVYMIQQDDKNIGFVAVSHTDGITCVEIIDCADDKLGTVAEICNENWKNSVFYSQQGYQEFIDAGMQDLNYRDESGDMNYGLAYGFTNGNVNILRDWFENRFVALPTENNTDINICYIRGDKILKEFKNSEIYKMNMNDVRIACINATNQNGMSAYPGFTFLNQSDFYNDNENIGYIFATSKETKKVVGVIRFGVWENNPDITCISYIDVAKGARHLGIATKMIECMNKVPLKKYFRVGPLTRDGHNYQINKVFERLVKDVIFVDNYRSV